MAKDLQWWVTWPQEVLQEISCTIMSYNIYIYTYVYIQIFNYYYNLNAKYAMYTYGAWFT